MNIRYHRTNVTGRILFLDSIHIVLGRFIKVFHVTLIDRVDLSTRRQYNLGIWVKWYNSVK
jgi:hypothetical protein